VQVSHSEGSSEPHWPGAMRSMREDAGEALTAGTTT
jgi:hypothetical protein